MSRYNTKHGLTQSGVLSLSVMDSNAHVGFKIRHIIRKIMKLNQIYSDSPQLCKSRALLWTPREQVLSPVIEYRYTSRVSRKWIQCHRIPNNLNGLPGSDLAERCSRIMRE